jgi:hypothetical protein
MKQFYITSKNIQQDTDEDCYLAPDDPVHELKITSYMGGLGSTTKLEELRIRNTIEKINNDRTNRRG